MFQENSRILWNEPVGPGCYHMGLRCNPGYARARAGQFVMVGLGTRNAPLLRRPFSIHRLFYDNGAVKGIELLYKVVGTGTRDLSENRPNDPVELLGPLGRGFFVPRDCRRVFLAAGGIGVAPLLFLADSLVQKGMDPKACGVFLGGRSKGEILCAGRFQELGFEVVLTTDDGTLGDQCLVTHPLDLALEARVPQAIFACGPMGMLACVAGIAEARHVPCQVSIEAAMACGMGACLGCAVEGADMGGHYLHVCCDGPVFEASVLNWQGVGSP